jgi:2-oxoglutarate ferredoxin oxidoreductase subunit beta
MFDDPHLQGHLPRPFGVFYETERACYEEQMELQIKELVAQKGKGDLNKLLSGRETWTIS